MVFDEARFGGAIMVRPGQRIDQSNADAFRDALASGVAAAAAGVVVDMSDVDYMSSAGLRALTIAHRAARSAGKSLAVAALTPLVLEIFAISRFDLVFALFDTVREALEAASPDGLGQYDAA